MLELLLATLVVGLLAASLITTLRDVGATPEDGTAPASLERAVETWLGGRLGFEELESLGGLDPSSPQGASEALEALTGAGRNPSRSESEQRELRETLQQLEGAGLLEEWLRAVRAEVRDGAGGAGQGSALDGFTVQVGDEEMVWSDGEPVRLAVPPG